MNNQTSVTGKEPWLAVILSSLVPGVGQIYTGKRLRGIIFIFLYLSLISLGIGISSQILPFFMAAVMLSIFNLFDAYRCARKVNSSEFENLRKGDKDPWFAVFLSRIIPGLGHAYQGQWGFAFLFFILILAGGFILAFFESFSEILFILGLFTTIGIFCFGLYHVYISSPTHRTKSKRLIVIVCLILLCHGFLSSLLEESFEARYIPSGAMLPTLEINDRLIINKSAYYFWESDYKILATKQIGKNSIRVFQVKDYPVRETRFLLCKT